MPSVRSKERQEEAKLRQEAYSKLSTREKLERAKARGGSKKEITKLQARLESLNRNGKK